MPTKHAWYHTEEYRGYRIKIDPDPDPENPREWDNFGHMVCWHRRYSLGDQKKDGFAARLPYIESPQDFKDWCKSKEAKGSIVLPLWLYDHSGITMTSGPPMTIAGPWSRPSAPGYPFSDRWDAGIVGFYLATPTMIRANYQCKRITKDIREQATGLMEAEVKEYDQYLTGDVWGYQVVVPETEEGGDVGELETSSCWGMFGYESALAEAKSQVDFTMRMKEYHHGKPD